MLIVRHQNDYKKEDIIATYTHKYISSRYSVLVTRDICFHFGFISHTHIQGERETHTHVHALFTIQINCNSNRDHTVMINCVFFVLYFSFIKK